MGILAFIIVLILAAQDAHGASATIALGKTYVNSDSSYGEFGYQVRDWEFNLGLVGVGSTKDGPQSSVIITSVSKLVRPNWCFLGGCNYYRIGVANVFSSPLVGPWNFRLGVGWTRGVFLIEAVHYSSAGIYENNTGLDAVQIRLRLPW